MKSILRRDIDDLELFANEPKGELTIVISEINLKKILHKILVNQIKEL